MLAAVERYKRLDHAAEWSAWKAQVDHIKSVMDQVPGVDPALAGALEASATRGGGLDDRGFELALRLLLNGLGSN